MERVNARAEILIDQESFDNWVVASGGNKTKVAVDLIKDISGQDTTGEHSIDDESKIEKISKVVGFYWGMA